MKELIDIITAIIEEIEELHPYKQPGNRDSYSEYNQGWSVCCDVLGDRIIEALIRRGELK